MPEEKIGKVIVRRTFTCTNPKCEREDKQVRYDKTLQGALKLRFCNACFRDPDPMRLDGQRKHYLCVRCHGWKRKAHMASITASVLCKGLQGGRALYDETSGVNQTCI